MNTNFKTIKQMTADAKELKAEIQELNGKISSLESEETRRLESFEEKNRVYEEQSESVIYSRRNELLLELDKARGDLTAIRDILSRSNSIRMDKKRELQDIENILVADQNLETTKSQMQSAWACFEKAKKGQNQVEFMKDQAVKLLEEARLKQEEFLEQAVLEEIEAGKQLPATKKKHQELIDEIDMQERRIKTLEAAIHSKVNETEADNEVFKEAQLAFQLAQKHQQEKNYIAALEKFAPIAHKFIAASKIVGVLQSDIKLLMDIDRLDKEIDDLRAKESKLLEAS